MSRTHPEIRIKYGWLLTNATADPLQKHWDPAATTRSREECEQITQNYIEFWKPYEKRITDAMYDVTGLEFYQNTIDVYVAPWFNAFSNPLVIGVIFDKQELLVPILTHELCHRLLSDNKSHDDKNTVSEYEELFGKHDFVTLVYIPVYAIMHEIFIDHIKEPHMLDAEKRATKDYQDAWDYVQKQGYKNIMKDLRKLYS